MSELRREFERKAFHMLAFVYLGAYRFLGWPRTVYFMVAWLVVVLVIETVRLNVPAVERFLVSIFSGMMRETERRHFSGIVHTTAGSLAAMVIARGDARIVGAAIGQLALADAAAALVGKAFGRTKILGGHKSFEGSLAALSVAYTVALLAGVDSGPALASALVATVVELLPTTGFFNDNLWLPTSSALTLAVLLRR